MHRQIIRIFKFHSSKTILIKSKSIILKLIIVVQLQLLAFKVIIVSISRIPQKILFVDYFSVWYGSIDRLFEQHNYDHPKLGAEFYDKRWQCDGGIMVDREEVIRFEQNILSFKDSLP